MRNLLFILTIISLLSCKNENKTFSFNFERQDNVHTHVLPHNMEKSADDTASMLSEEDKNLIAHAKGRNVEWLNTKELSSLIEQEETGLVLFNFWKIACSSCLKNYEHLAQVQNTIGTENMKIISINLDEKTQQDLVNGFIREHGIVGDIYQLAKTQSSKSSKYLDEIKELPALFLVNNEEGIRTLYQQEFEYEALLAIIETFALGMGE